MSLTLTILFSVAFLGLILLWAVKSDKKFHRNITVDVLELLPVDEEWCVRARSDYPRQLPFDGSIPFEMLGPAKYSHLLELNESGCNCWIFADDVASSAGDSVVGSEPVVVMELQRNKEYGVRIEQHAWNNINNSIQDTRFKLVNCAHADGKKWLISTTSESEDATIAAMNLFTRCASSKLASIQILHRALTVSGGRISDPQSYVDLWEVAKQVAAKTEGL